MISRQRAWSPYRVILAATLLNMVSYVDRICISVAGPSIRREFNLTPIQLGVIFSSFSLSYALMQLPWGAAADRWSPRRIVGFAILAWSGFTALTGAAVSYRIIVLIRFAFGGLEAALAPAITSAFARWIPDNARATAFGVFLGGGRLGGAFAPAAAAFLLLRYGWRSTFIVFAAAGVMASLIWFRVVPPQLPTNPNSRRFTQTGVHLWSFQMVALLLVAFGYTVMWQFYATWFPTYLIERRGFTLSEAGRYASLPFLFGIGSSWAGGVICDALGRKTSPALGRGIVGCFSMLLAALLYYLGIISSDKAAPWLFATAAGVGDLLLAAVWTAAADLGGKSAGTFSGLMNCASNFGAFVSPIAIGAAIQRSKDWDSVLMIGLGTTLASAILWVGVNWPRKLDASLAT